MHCSRRATHPSHDGPIVREPGFLLSQQARAGTKECMMSPNYRLSWMGLKSWQAGHRTWRRDQRDKRVRPTLTLLEERTLLSTLNLTVTTLADDPVTPISEQTTLRDAITQANASTDSQEVINFAPGLQGTIDRPVLCRPLAIT